MTNGEKFEEIFGCSRFQALGYCDSETEAEIWEGKEYKEPTIKEE